MGVRSQKNMAFNQPLPSSKTLLLATGIGVLILIIGYMIYFSFAPVPTSTSPTTPLSSESQATSFTPDRIITITAKKWSFTPDTIRVKQGERVRLLITSRDVTHGINIPQLGINKVLNPGETTTIDFTANTVGIFPFTCSVYCGQGHGAMKGKLIVEPAS